MHNVCWRRKRKLGKKERGILCNDLCGRMEKNANESEIKKVNSERMSEKKRKGKGGALKREGASSFPFCLVLCQ